MNLAWHQVAKAIIHEPVPLYAGQATEVRADHMQPKMTSTVAGARMPGMLVALVHDAQFERM